MCYASFIKNKKCKADEFASANAKAGNFRRSQNCFKILLFVIKVPREKRGTMGDIKINLLPENYKKSYAIVGFPLKLDF